MHFLSTSLHFVMSMTKENIVLELFCKVIKFKQLKCVLQMYTDIIYCALKALRMFQLEWSYKCNTHTVNESNTYCIMPR